MHFKEPEILYFLFLLIIPFLVHLFQLRRFKKEYFTNVAFLKVLSIQTRKSSKLKKWLLLATRLLILAALIFAFAQPFFKAKENKSANNEMYIILDNSFSMQSKGQQGELLKRAVENLLKDVPENQIFSLITTSESFWNTDIKMIKTELQNLKYSAFPFELDNLMSKIKSQKSNLNKDIIVITDGIDLKQKQLNAIDKDFNSYFLIPKAEQQNNVSIDSVFIKQTLSQFYEIGVKLSAFGNDLQEIPIALYNNNKLIAKTLIEFKTQTEFINFTIPKTDFNGFVTIEDNGLEFDNSFYFNISKPQKTNILSIGSSEKNNFLARIYNESEFNYSNFDISKLDYNIIDQQDAIILNEIITIPEALQTTLKSFVEKGGNLIVIPSFENNITNLNTFINKLGSLKFNPIQEKEKLITKIAYNHPLFSNVFNKKVLNFQYPNTKKSFSISTPNAAILNYDDQSLFLTSLQNQISNIYVFSAPINVQNSNFQKSPLIVPVFYNMVQKNQKSGVLSFEIGKKEVFLIEANVSKDEIVNIKNKQEKFIPIQQVLNKKVKLTFNDYPEKAGNFGIFKQNEFIKNVSFNFNRSESDLTKSNENLLGNLNKIDSVASIFDIFQSERTDTEFWKWCAVLTLLFLIAELFIQKFVK